MKTLAATVIFCLAVTAYSQNSEIVYKSEIIPNIEIRQRFQDTPRVSAGNIPEDYSYQYKWLVIEVRYETVEAEIRKNRYKWLDDVVVEYQVLLPSLYNGNKVLALMDGAITYWSISLDGEKHYSQAFIMPRILQRYANPDLNLKRKSTARDIPSRVTFRTKDNQLLAKCIFVPRGSTKNGLENSFEKARKALSVVKLPDTIFSRDRTPWAVLNFDKYEIIKRKK